MTFNYAFARPTKSAFDVTAERVGVYRDYAHTALTLCRCMNIPARYTTGHLGEIGISPSESAMDFSGWFEVSLTTSYGNAPLRGFNVWTNEVGEDALKDFA